MFRRAASLLACVVAMLGSATAAESARPNVLFIAVDDLNDWVGCLGGNEQSITPNIDRLAASGVLFTNAHCAAPACNPSRTAIFTGIAPHKSGMYDNGQSMRDVLPDAVLLPKHFSNHGYWSAGSGKLLHYFIEPASWDDYYPDKQKDDPFPRTLYPETRPLSLPRGGPWQYVETDWGPLDATDEEFGGDWLVSKWIGEQLARQHDKPFFLACGIYRPHEPWFVPKKYFEPFPIDEIELPPGYRENDLDDVPELGQKMARNRYFVHIQKQGQWKQAIQGYLASIHFADAMLGRVMEALANGPNAENTIVVLWSDHGWQLGEKEHWQKYTPWRAVTRVPLIVRVPKDVSGLEQGTTAGTTCDRPVSLASLFPTLTELTGVASVPAADAPSLVPLLSDPSADWPHVAVTDTGVPGRFTVSADRFQYIRYEDGSEELYDIDADPYEWTNLANDLAYDDQLVAMRRRSPATFAPKPVVKDADLPLLKWTAVNELSEVPASKPDGSKFRVVFRNEGEQAVQLFWMQRDGQPKPEPYATIEPGKRHSLETRPGAVWLLTTPAMKPRGYFVVGDRTARAIVP